MSVTVRRATRKDARRVAEMAIKLALQHKNYDSQRFSELAPLEQAQQYYGSQTDTTDAAILVAELENEIVGFTFIQYEAKDYANLLENAAWLHDIYIEEVARGHNAGNLLIESSIKAAKELGADKLMLSVAAKNEFAKDFFARNGFKATMVEMMLEI
jgi:GNAT superfamily N-acetyltransferase